MELKHKYFIEKFHKCEIVNCTTRNREAFRWVFQLIDDERNFIPRYLHSCYHEAEKNNCVGYALSMFDSEEQAIARLNILSKGRKDLYKKLGTHIAKGTLTINDGISNNSSIDSDTSGHFSFFEYTSTDLSKRFTVSKQIMPYSKN